jgi:hypothetical protein
MNFVGTRPSAVIVGSNTDEDRQRLQGGGLVNIFCFSSASRSISQISPKLNSTALSGWITDETAGDGPNFSL